MCTTCGCGSDGVTISDGTPAHDHDAHEAGWHVHADGTAHSHHAHGHDDGHGHAHPHDHDAEAHVSAGPARIVPVEQDILAGNNAIAAANRRRLADRGIFATNLVSSPGSGKTTLLCRTIEMLGPQGVAVIEGDQQTSNDAERIRATGARAVQVNTGRGCHRDAQMVARAMDRLPLDEGSLLLIENVGNLVCPAEFDLGEAHKVVILSVTEGEDKPLKYPHMFHAADVMIVNKLDLLPYVRFDMELAVAHARRINPRIEVMRVSATTGEGMQDWVDYLRAGAAGAVAAQRHDLEALRQKVAHLEAQLQR
jgi:hydrogenase nickel incorporation protein HypB